MSASSDPTTAGADKRLEPVRNDEVEQGSTTRTVGTRLFDIG